MSGHNLPLGDAAILAGAYAGTEDEDAVLAAMYVRRFMAREDARDEVLADVLGMLGLGGAA